MRKLNILYIAHEGRMGGATKALIEMVIEMKKKGHNVTVLIPFKNCALNKKLEELGVDTISQFYIWWEYPQNEGKIIEILYRIAYKFNGLSMALLVGKLKKINLDIIHTNTSVLDIGMKLSEKMRVQHVWHFREFGYEDHKLKYIKGAKNSYAEIKDSNSHLIYISKDIECYYSQRIGKNKGNIIYDGVGREYVWKKKFTEPRQDNIVRFLISGALQPGKGQSYAIKAAGYLKKKGYTNFKVYIAGRDIADYQKELQKICEEEAVSELIEFKGFVSNIEKLRRECDIELVCSQREAFGRVTVEAMLCSNPVIGSNAGANSELIDDGIDGFLYKYDDVQELAKCMRIFMENLDKIAIMGKNAYLKASKTYTSQKNADEIEKLYETIIDELEDR